MTLYFWNVIMIILIIFVQFVSKLRQPEKAAEIFEAMESKANVKPNAFSYSALISALGRMGQWQDAERYFLQMKECSENDPTCKPNAIAYASMITGELLREESSFYFPIFCFAFSKENNYDI